MKIKLIFVGKTKEKNLDQGIGEYLKRLGHYFDFEIIYIKEESVSKTFDSNMVKKSEGDKILEKMDKDYFTIILDEFGKNFRSMDFANLISEKKDLGEKLSFIIGGAFGLSEDVKNAANFKLSLSNMTFTHEMARLILLEQLYRASCIISGKEYHIE